MKPLLSYIIGVGIALAVMLAMFTSERWPAYQRVSTVLAAQEAGPPTQNTDDSLGGLLDEEPAPKTTADENAPPRSILSQVIDFMSDEEFVVFLGVTGYTAEELDKKENEYVKLVQSNPKLWEEHLDESIERSSKSVRAAVEETLEVDFENIDTNNFFIQMMIFKEAENEAIERMRNGTPTQRQQEEADMKRLLDRELKAYQYQTNSIAEWKEHVRRDVAREKENPNDVNYKYDRMCGELYLAQAQARFDLHVPLWVHLGILPEDNVNKRDETLDSFALLNMSIRIGEEVEKKEREIWNASDPKMQAWIAAEEAKLNAVMARSETLVGEELDRWFKLEDLDWDEAGRIAMDDAKFASWWASVNEAAAPPAQNPGGLLLEETSPLPAPVTNTDDGGETSPPPSPGSEEETTSGGLGDDAVARHRPCFSRSVRGCSHQYIAKMREDKKMNRITPLVWLGVVWICVHVNYIAAAELLQPQKEPTLGELKVFIAGEVSADRRAV